MNSFSVLDLIKKRIQYPLGHKIGDAWVDEILQSDDEIAYLITTENLSTLTGIQGRNKRRILFEKYHISGIFGLSNPMAGTAVNLMLLVLRKDANNNVISGTYNNGLYYGRSYRLGLREDSVPLETVFRWKFIRLIFVITVEKLSDGLQKGLFLLMVIVINLIPLVQRILT